MSRVLLVDRDGAVIDSTSETWLIDWARISKRPCQLIKLDDLDALPETPAT